MVGDQVSQAIVFTGLDSKSVKVFRYFSLFMGKPGITSLEGKSIGDCSHLGCQIFHAIFFSCILSFLSPLTVLTRSPGMRQQQDQNPTSAGIRLPRSGLLHPPNLCPPYDRARAGRIRFETVRYALTRRTKNFLAVSIPLLFSLERGNGTRWTEKIENGQNFFRMRRLERCGSILR